jgi:hypothetical protein
MTPRGEWGFFIKILVSGISVEKALKGEGESHDLSDGLSFSMKLLSKFLCAIIIIYDYVEKLKSIETFLLAVGFLLLQERKILCRVFANRIRCWHGKFALLKMLKMLKMIKRRCLQRRIKFILIDSII